MTTQDPRNLLSIRVTNPQAIASSHALLDSPSSADVQELERQVEYIVDDCFFTVGQAE